MNKEYNQKKISKENIKIALISFQKDAERIPPIGLIYIATYINKIGGISKDNIKVIEVNFHDIEREIEKFEPELYVLPPDVAIEYHTPLVVPDIEHTTGAADVVNVT